MPRRARDPEQLEAVRLAGFEAKVKQQLRDEYKIRQVTKISGNTLEEHP